MNQTISPKVQALIKKGVQIPNPESVFVGDDVDPDRVGMRCTGQVLDEEAELKPLFFCYLSHPGKALIGDRQTKKTRGETVVRALLQVDLAE